MVCFHGFHLKEAPDMPNLIYKFYLKLKQNPVVGAALLFMLLIVLVWHILSLSFAEDISKLIPQNEDNKTLQKVLKTANFSDKIIVHIKKKDAVSTETLTNYAEDFLEELNASKNPYIKSVQGYIEEESLFETLDVVYENLPYFLTAEDYQHIEAKITSDSIAAITQQNYETLISPSGLIAKKTLVRDPLGLSLMGINHLKSLGFNDDFKIVNGFLVNKKETDVLLFITPKFPTSETQKNTEFSTALYNLQSKLNTRYQSEISASYFGGVLIAVANANQIKTDVILTVSIALSLLLMVFIVFYRSVFVPIILLLPTVFGALVALAILSLFKTQISAISLGVGAVLLGVTLDYALHILTHLRAQHTIEDTLNQVTKPIIMSSVTTALAFFCLLFINSDALQDLGLFAGLSVLSAAFFALVLIPVLYKSPKKKTLPKQTVIDRLASYPFHQKKGWIIGLIMLLIGSVFFYSQVSFNKNLSSLNFVPQHLKQAEKELDQLTNASDKSVYLVSYGTTLDEALQHNDLLFSTLKKQKATNSLVSFTSVAPLVKSKRTQKEGLQQWTTFFNEERKQFLKEEFILKGEVFGFKPETHQAFYNLLNQPFNILHLEDLKGIASISPEDFMSSNDQFHTVTTLVKLKDNQVNAFKAQFKNQKGTILIDRQAINEDLLGQLKNSFNTLMLYCFGAVLLVLFIFYRNIKLVLATILPIVITWLITIGLMAFFNIQFNVFNIIISTFIFGLGVDYSIFITNGLITNNKQEHAVLPTYKTSVILSVITTLLGVGILFLAKHPALQSLALVSVIGISTALLVSFTLQPLVYNVLCKSKK